MKNIILGLVASSILLSCASKERAVELPSYDNVSRPTSSNSSVKSDLPILKGNWRSVSPEPVNGFYATREYRMSQSRYELVYSIAADKDMKKLLLIYRAEGPYTIETPSIEVSGANLVTFKASRRYLKLKANNANLIKNLGLAKCGLSLNKEMDISEKGCGLAESVSECGQEYNIAKLENGLLYLGERNLEANLCSTENRPKSLGLPLKKLY